MVGLCACLLATFVFLRPHRLLNGPVEYVVVAGHSMDPHFASGDLVVVRRASSYHVGDVIAFKVHAAPSETGGRVIHRIVGGNPTRGWITRGDNRTTNDPWRVHPADIFGREWLHVPFYRHITAVIPPQLLFASLAGFAAVLIAWPPKLRRTTTPTPTLALPLRRSSPSHSHPCHTTPTTPRRPSGSRGPQPERHDYRQGDRGWRRSQAPSLPQRSPGAARLAPSNARAGPCCGDLPAEVRLRFSNCLASGRRRAGRRACRRAEDRTEKSRWHP